MSTLCLILFQHFFFLYTVWDEFIQRTCLLLKVVSHLKLIKPCRKRIKIKCTSNSSESSNLSAFNFETRWDISMIYSLILPFSLYFIEIRQVKSVLISVFSFLTKLFSTSWTNFLAVAVVSNIVPLNPFGATFLMIIKHK